MPATLSAQGVPKQKRKIIIEKLVAAKQVLISGQAATCDSLLTVCEELGKKQLAKDSLGYEIIEVRATLLSRQQNAQQALELVEKAYQQRVALYGEKSTQAAKGLQLRADYLAYLGKYQEALLVAQSALLLLREIEEEESLLAASTYFSIASAQLVLQQYTQAKSSLENCLRLQEKLLLPKAGELSSTYKRLGELESQLGNFAQAATYFEQAIEINLLQGASRRILLPGIYYGLANAQFNNGKTELAREHFTQALSIAEEVNGRGTMPTVTFLNGLGQCLVLSSRPSEGLVYLNRAEAIMDQAPSANPIEHASLLAGIGMAYQYLQKEQEAVTALEKGIQQIRSAPTGFAPLEYQLLTILGAVYSNSGQMPACLRVLEEARKVAEESGQINERIQAQLYDVLALTYADIGAYDQALRTTKIGLDLLKVKLTEPNEAIGRLYGQMAQLKVKAEQYPEAIVLFDRALNNLSTDGAYSNDYLNLLLAKSQAQLKAGNLTQVAQLVTTLPDLLKNVPELSPSNETASWQIRGEVAQARGDLPTAIRCFNEAVTVHRKYFPGKHGIEADLLEKLGLAKLEGGAAAGAKEVLQEALTAYQKDPFLASAEVMPTYYALSQAYRMEGNIVLAKAYLDSTLWSATRLPDYTTSPEARRLLLARNNETLAALLDDQFDNKNAPDVDLKEVFSVCDFLRYDAVREQLRRVRAYQNDALPNDLWERQGQLKEKLRQNEAAIRELIATEAVERDAMLALRLTREELLRAMEAEESRLQQEHPRYAAFSKAYAPVSPTALQEKVGYDKSLVEYFVTPDKVYLFTLNDGKLSLTHSSHGGRLNVLIEQLQSGIVDFYTATDESWAPDLEANSNMAYARAAHELYQLLIAPAEATLKEQVVIVTDGLLGLVPFNALLSKAVPPERIGRYGSYPFTVYNRGYTRLFSGALLLQDTPAPVEYLPAKSVLGMAPFAPAPSIPKPSATTVKFRAVNKDDDPSLRDLPPLPSSAAEVAAITRLWSGDSFFEQAASRDAFLGAMTNYRILHLATHAQADEKDGAAGFLAFRNASTGYQRVYARDLYQYTLPTELVFLSACETGRGAYAKGEGIVSLGRAFRYAGARSIFSTLWLLADDEATAQLTIDFYRKLKAGLPKDTALRQAQLDYLNRVEAEQQHPFFWAGIIGSGNMRPLR